MAVWHTATLKLAANYLSTVESNSESENRARCRESSQDSLMEDDSTEVPE